MTPYLEENDSPLTRIIVRMNFVIRIELEALSLEQLLASYMKSLRYIQTTSHQFLWIRARPNLSVMVVNLNFESGKEIKLSTHDFKSIFFFFFCKGYGASLLDRKILKKKKNQDKVEKWGQNLKKKKVEKPARKGNHDWKSEVLLPYPLVLTGRTGWLPYSLFLTKISNFYLYKLTVQLS